MEILCKGKEKEREWNEMGEKRTGGHTLQEQIQKTRRERSKMTFIQNYAFDYIYQLSTQNINYSDMYHVFKVFKITTLYATWCHSKPLIPKQWSKAISSFQTVNSYMGSMVCRSWQVICSLDQSLWDYQFSQHNPYTFFVSAQENLGLDLWRSLRV